MSALSPWHILLIVAVAFVVFGVGGFKRIGRRGVDQVKATGEGLKGAAQELQSSYAAPADEDSAIYQATRVGREKAAAAGASALEAAKEAREGIAGIADDTRSAVGGAEPQTAVGRAAQTVAETARDVRAGVSDAEHEPQSALGKAAKTAGEAAKSRVDMLGDTANAFKEGVDGAAPAEAADPALPAAEQPPAPDQA